MINLISEGLIFSIFACGTFIAVRWIRLTDLTPYISFTIGACAYSQFTAIGLSPIIAVFIAGAAGAVCAVIAAALNRALILPAFLAGLGTSIGIFSLGPGIIRRPAVYAGNKFTLLRAVPAGTYNLCFFIMLVLLVSLMIWFLIFLARQAFISKVRAAARLPFLCYAALLALSNSIIGISGALFVQNDFPGGTYIGVGQTLIGPISLILIVLLIADGPNTIVSLILVTIATIVYQFIFFLAVTAGWPVEFFRMVSVGILLVVFMTLKNKNDRVLKTLRWLE